MTLHEAIIKLLKEKGTPMTTTEIANALNENCLFGHWLITMAEENKYAHNCVCEVINLRKEIKFIFNGLN